MSVSVRVRVCVCVCVCERERACVCVRTHMYIRSLPGCSLQACAVRLCKCVIERESNRENVRVCV